MHENPLFTDFLDFSSHGITSRLSVITMHIFLTTVWGGAYAVRMAIFMPYFLRHTGVRIFHVNPRFHPSLVLNLGLPWETPVLWYRCPFVRHWCYCAANVSAWLDAGPAGTIIGPASSQHKILAESSWPCQVQNDLWDYNHLGWNFPC